MNTVFIFGNGFDLNMGLKTSYKDFYGFYKEQEDDPDSVILLKQNIQNSINQVTKKSDPSYIDWSDFEKGLGEYTKNFQSEEEAETVYYDIRSKLGDFINKAEISKDELFGLDSQKFFDHLAQPESFLPDNFKLEFNILRSNVRGASSIRILTFNYSSTVEKLVADGSASNQTIISGEVLHLHRRTINPIFGVNDTSQMSNEILSKSEFVRNMFIKPDTNTAFQDRHVDDCKRIIQNANIISIFGVSLGGTDVFWWREIRKCLDSQYFKMIYHYFPDSKDELDYSNDPPRRVKKENEIRGKIVGQMGLPEEVELSYRSKIYIDIMRRNDHLFKIGKV